MKTLRLLLPEWQGFGVHADSARGARKLAELLFDGETDVLAIEAPDSEELSVDEGVCGVSSISARLEKTLRELRQRAPDRIVMIGGTCAVELAPVSYLNQRCDGDLAVLWLDAHADLNTPSSSPSGHLHGMALRALMGEGHPALTSAMQPAPQLKPQQLALVGARDLDPPEAAFVQQGQIALFGDDVFASPAPLFDWLKPWRSVYVHFDVDVLNPESFHGALMHAPGGGPSVEQAAALIGALQARVNVVGFSIVEFVDRHSETAQSFARVVRERCRVS